MVIKKNMTEDELDVFLSYIEKNEMRNAPKNLKAEILQQCESRKYNIQSMKTKQDNAHQNKVQFWLYSLKISVAVAAAVFLLAFIDTDSVIATVDFQKNADRISMSVLLNEKSNEWSNKLSGMSDFFEAR